MQVRPNFFIIGAQKSGSSWLANALDQHDEIFVAPKEIHYFDKIHNKKRGMDWYLSHFRDASAFRLVGEKTPEYLWAHGIGGEGHNPDVHLDLTREFPDARYLAVLRNPVDRAVSAVVHMIKTNRLPFLWPIDKLFEDRHAKLLEPWGILEKGLYARQIDAYLKLISREQLKILIFERDVKARPTETLRSVCQFLEVSDVFPFQKLGEKRNRSPSKRHSIYNMRNKGRLRSWFHARITANSAVSITPQTRQKLSAFYHEENQRLREMLGCSIAEWEHEVE